MNVVDVAVGPLPSATFKVSAEEASPLLGNANVDPAVSSNKLINAKALIANFHELANDFSNLIMMTDLGSVF